MRRVLSACLMLWCAAAAPPAAAAELIVEWTAPVECPDEGEVISRVKHSLGDAVTGDLTATTRVTRAPESGGYRARVSFTSAAGPGERTLENSSCEILADSVALVIALSAARTSGDSNGEGSGLALAISGHATALTGALPRLALGAGGALALEGVGPLRFELNGTYYATQSSTFDDANIGAEFKLLRFGVRGCALWSFGPVDLAPCAGALLVRIEGAGFGGNEQAGGRAYLGGPSLGGFGRLRLLSFLALTLAADGFVPLARRAFVYRDRGRLHRPAPVLFQVFVAPEVRF